MTMNDYQTVSNLRTDVARLRLIGRDLVLALPTDTFRETCQRLLDVLPTPNHN